MRKLFWWLCLPPYEGSRVERYVPVKSSSLLFLDGCAPIIVMRSIVPRWKWIVKILILAQIWICVHQTMNNWWKIFWVIYPIFLLLRSHMYQTYFASHHDVVFYCKYGTISKQFFSEMNPKIFRVRNLTSEKID